MTLAWPVPGSAAGHPVGERLTPFRDQLFREGTLRDLRLDGRRYCVLDRGQGPGLLLLHGLGGSLYDWRHLILPLSARHRVIAVDLLGAGESEIPPTEDYGIATQARRVKGLMDLLGVDCGTLVGNSYGGGIALRLAEDWPERVDRLVLLNSACYPEDIPAYVSWAHAPGAECVTELLPLGSMVRWVLRKSYRTVEKLTDEELEAYVQELRVPGRRRAIIQVIRALVPPDTTEFELRLKAIRAPTLLLWGRADQTIPVRLGRRLAQDLSDARLVELDAGHVPNQEVPGEVLKRMTEFLR